MKMFSKNSSNSDTTLETAPTGAKRDVTIRNEPKKRPDHVRAETDDCVWDIPLTLDEQRDLGGVYESGDFGDEAQMLERFTETIYQGTAAMLSMEIRPSKPGEVFLKASTGHLFRRSSIVRYKDVGRTICEWIVESQSRKELVADLVAAFPEDQV